MGKLGFIAFGMGSIKAGIAAYPLERKNVALAAAINSDPEKIGCDAGVLQTATGCRAGKPIINIELQPYLRHPAPWSPTLCRR